MDKKKVKELLEQISEDIEQYTAAKSYCSFETKKEILKQLKEVKSEIQKSDWVSVEDGLPDLDELVVACNKNRPDNWWETFRDSQMADEWEDENGFPIEEKVTHWKPIEKLEE